MKPLITCLLLTLLMLPFYKGHAQDKPNESEQQTSFQLLCAEQMLRHIKDPDNRSKGLALIAMDYYALGNNGQAKLNFEEFLKIYPQIDDKNLRYDKLLKVTNNLSPILSESQLQGIFDTVCQDSVDLSMLNKIALGQLAMNLQHYETSEEIIVSTIRYFNLIKTLNYNGVRGEFENDLHAIIGSIISSIIKDTTFASIDSKLQTLKQFALLDHLGLNDYTYQRYIENEIFNALKMGEVDRAVSYNQSYLNTYGRANGLALIIDNLLIDGEVEKANEVYDKYKANFEDETIYYYYNRYFITTILRLGRFEAVNLKLQQEQKVENKCYFYFEIAKSFFQNKDGEHGSLYLDSSLTLIRNEEYGYTKMELYLELASLAYDIGETALSKSVLFEAMRYKAEHDKYDFSDYNAKEIISLLAMLGYHNEALNYTQEKIRREQLVHGVGILNLAYQITLSRGDTSNAIHINTGLSKEIGSIRDVRRKNTFIQYIGVNFARHKDYKMSLKIAEEFSTNRYHNILNFLRGFIEAYESNERKHVPEEYYSKFLDILEVEYGFEENYMAYQFLIEHYYLSNLKSKGFDFELEIEKRLERYDMEREFGTSNKSSRMHVLFSKDLLLYHLYLKSGNTAKLKSLMDNALKICAKRKYGIEDLNALLNLNYKFLRYGKWGATISRGEIFLEE